MQSTETTLSAHGARAIKCLRYFNLKFLVQDTISGGTLEDGILELRGRCVYIINCSKSSYECFAPASTSA